MLLRSRGGRGDATWHVLTGPPCCFWRLGLPRPSNNLQVWLGGVPRDAIFQDRAFNTASLLNAQLGRSAVESVTYDVRDAPDRWEARVPWLKFMRRTQLMCRRGLSHPWGFAEGAECVEAPLFPRLDFFC